MYCNEYCTTLTFLNMFLKIRVAKRTLATKTECIVTALLSVYLFRSPSNAFMKIVERDYACLGRGKGAPQSSNSSAARKKHDSNI